MAIQIAREFHVRMSQLLHHEKDTCSFRQQDTGERVSAVLHSDFSHTGFFKQRVEVDSS